MKKWPTRFENPYTSTYRVNATSPQIVTTTAAISSLNTSTSNLSRFCFSKIATPTRIVQTTYSLAILNPVKPFSSSKQTGKIFHANMEKSNAAANTA